MEKIKNIRKRLRHQRSVRRRKLGLSTPTQIICVSFIAVIALGTLLLTLPIASRHGRLDVLNAMFTATSATCVTGLVVRDTWTQFTWFGQAVVLLLIQVGGLGLVTLTSFFALAMRRRMGFRDLRSVSYTHLDVYKRQSFVNSTNPYRSNRGGRAKNPDGI